jgi:hypothetical protein
MSKIAEMQSKLGGMAIPMPGVRPPDQKPSSGAGAAVTLSHATMSRPMIPGKSRKKKTVATMSGGSSKVVAKKTPVKVEPKKGFMTKKGAGVFTSWKRRFFVLDGLTLRYYVKEGDKDPKGEFVVMTLDKAPGNKGSEGTIKRKGHRCLQLETVKSGKERHLVAYADSDEETEKWTKHIELILTRQGAKKVGRRLSLNHLGKFEVAPPSPGIMPQEEEAPAKEVFKSSEQVVDALGRSYIIVGAGDAGENMASKTACQSAFGLAQVKERKAGFVVAQMLELGATAYLHPDAIFEDMLATPYGVGVLLEEKDGVAHMFLSDLGAMGYMQVGDMAVSNLRMHKKVPTPKVVATKYGRGMMKKQGELCMLKAAAFRGRKWKPRYFQLHSGGLAYFKNGLASQNARGFIHLSAHSVCTPIAKAKPELMNRASYQGSPKATRSASKSSGSPVKVPSTVALYEFSITEKTLDRKREYRLAASTAAEMTEWIIAIEEHVSMLKKRLQTEADDKAKAVEQQLLEAKGLKEAKESEADKARRGDEMKAEVTRKQSRNMAAIARQQSMKEAEVIEQQGIMAAEQTRKKSMAIIGRKASSVELTSAIASTFVADVMVEAAKSIRKRAREQEEAAI